MFEIYKFEYDCGFITADAVKSYVAMDILSEADYHKIVGDSDETNASPLE